MKRLRRPVFRALPLTDESTPEEIAKLEAEIERLAATAEGCRRVIHFGRVAVVAGAAIFLGGLLGFFFTPPAAYLVATALILGGVIAWGSNRSTLDECLGDIAALEEQRTALIDTLRLR